MKNVSNDIDAKILKIGNLIRLKEEDILRILTSIKTYKDIIIPLVI